MHLRGCCLRDARVVNNRSIRYGLCERQRRDQAAVEPLVTAHLIVP